MLTVDMRLRLCYHDGWQCFGCSHVNGDDSATQVTLMGMIAETMSVLASTVFMVSLLATLQMLTTGVTVIVVTIPW